MANRGLIETAVEDYVRDIGKRNVHRDPADTLLVEIWIARRLRINMAAVRARIIGDEIVFTFNIPAGGSLELREKLSEFPSQIFMTKLALVFG